MRWTWWIVVAVATFLAACGGDDVAGPSSPSTADGDTLFARHCSSCHGVDLRGTDSGPSLLSIVYEPGHHPDASFRSAIRNGVAPHHWNFGPMLPVDGLSDVEIDAVIAYVRAEQDRHGFEPYPP